MWLGVCESLGKRRYSLHIFAHFGSFWGALCPTWSVVFMGGYVSYCEDAWQPAKTGVHTGERYQSFRLKLVKLIIKCQTEPLTKGPLLMALISFLCWHGDNSVVTMWTMKLWSCAPPWSHMGRDFNPRLYSKIVSGLLGCSPAIHWLLVNETDPFQVNSKFWSCV